MANQLNAERDLLAACREWRRLAEAEGQAIRIRNWALCAACQQALQQLRDRMSALMPAVRAEWRQSGAARAARMQTFDDAVHQLIELERRNHTLRQSRSRGGPSQNPTAPPDPDSIEAAPAGVWFCPRAGGEYNILKRKPPWTACPRGFPGGKRS